MNICDSYVPGKDDRVPVDIERLFNVALPCFTRLRIRHAWMISWFVSHIGSMYLISAFAGQKQPSAGKYIIPKNPNPSLEWFFQGSNPILQISQDSPGFLGHIHGSYGYIWTVIKWLHTSLVLHPLTDANGKKSTSPPCGESIRVTLKKLVLIRKFVDGRKCIHQLNKVHPWKWT